jgi:hypothetical protein
MNDHTLLEVVRRADPVSTEIGEPPDATFERVLACARAEAQSRSSLKQLRRQWRHGSRWAVAAGGVTAVALSAVAVMALLPAGDTGGPSPAAAAVLLHAARTAAQQPASVPPGPGQFVYTKSQGLNENTTVPASGKAFNVFQTVIREAWIGSDGSGRIKQTEGPPRFATTVDRAAWIADGKPALGDGSGDMNSNFGAGQLSYVNLTTLPTEPGQLKQLIEKRTIEGGPPGNAETFTIIGDLLRETYAPPGVRSALYTVAAQLPGVQLIGAAHDQLGRPGTAVGYTAHGNTQELIFDPQTSALLAEQTVDNTGAVVGWTAYLSSGVVDSTSATTSDAP